MQLQQILKQQMEKEMEVVNQKKAKQHQIKSGEQQQIKGLEQMEQEIINREKIDNLSRRLESMKSYEYDLERIQSKNSPKNGKQ